MSTHSSQLNLDPHCPVHAERVRTDSQGSLLSDRTRRMLAEAIVHSIVQIGVNELLEKNRDRSKDETEILIRSSSALLVDRLLDRMYR